MNYSVRSEENSKLSPFEKTLRNEFLSEQNTLFLFENTKKLIDKNISYGNVVDQMYETFTLSLSDNPPSTSYLNNVCINKIRSDFERKTNAIIRTRERSFIKSNIPQNFLPRPSFSAQEDSNDRLVEFPLFSNKTSTN